MDDFKNILSYGAPERKKEFIRMFVKSLLMYPDRKKAKIVLYKRPLPDIIKENKTCIETEEIVYTAG